MSFWHASKEQHGWRFWWHFTDRRVLRVEIYWWTHFCHASLSCGEGWTASLALPPLAIWLTLEGFPIWQPSKTCVATWDGGRTFTIPDERECQVSCHDWTLRLTPWGKSMEWCSADPWWVRGVSWDLERTFLGPITYRSTPIGNPISILIPMPEGVYPAMAQREYATWTRPRWFTRRRSYVSVNVPNGIPFAGKGENSWDCGDDGLFGYSVEGDSIEHAIAHGIELVLNSRRKYGAPSEETIHASLVADPPSPLVERGGA